MIENTKAIRPGATLKNSAGRDIQVEDVFVPKNNVEKSRALPPSFRNLGRKIVLFRCGSITRLNDAAKHYRLSRSAH